MFNTFGHTTSNLILTAPAAPSRFFYVSPINRANYSLSTITGSATQQEAYCNSIGGHLASYDNATEQNEVERSFIRQGLLAPAYHKRYFIGASYNVSSTAWEWLDVSNPPPAAPHYIQWAAGEPDLDGGACSIANFTVPGYTPLGTAAWQSANCSAEHPAMCKTRFPGSVPPQNYTASNNVTYSFSTALLPASSASLFCNTMGGHLVSYESEGLQIEVRQGQELLCW